MQLVDHDTFLKQLGQLFDKRKDKGSIWLTHKRLLNDGPDATMQDRDDVEYPCLLRVTDGDGTKFSTKVNSSELFKFHTAYGALLKASLSTNLRKRDKKREKQAAEESAKRKAHATQPVKIDGQKRGAGRRKRQRQVKALIKQQESQKKFKEREEKRAKAKVDVVL